MTVAIDMQGVTKEFRGRPALSDISWIVETGSIHGLIGANGAGKTTLLRLALGLLWPDQGTIAILGQRLERENAPLRQRVHYAASGRALAPGFRVAEWLRYASLLYERWDAARCQRLIKALELDPDKVIGHLSHGMQTSLQLVVAIASRPDLLLLDEPTNGLDVVVKRQILQLIIDMAAAEGTTVVIASHNIEDIERMADTISVLYRGQFILKGEMESIKNHMHRLQVVIPGEWPSDVAQDPRITRVERRGHVGLVTVQGPAEPVAALLQKAGATLVEPIDMDLTDVFRAVLEKEGYTREGLEWDSLA